MSIGQGLTLVTGATGSGKTALVVSWLADMQGQRPVCVMGIPELKIDHQPAPPLEEWVEERPDKDDPSLLLPYFTFAPGSIVVLDEAQRVFRPRSTGAKVPAAVAAFETRRHTGCDFVLLTQHPGLLDANVRKLVNRHVHVHTTFMGSYLLEWPGLGAPDEASSRDIASRKRYKPDKRVFGLYKSAEVHTKVVRRRPKVLYVLLALIPVLGLLIWNIYGRMSERINPELAAAEKEVVGDMRRVGRAVAGGGQAVEVTGRTLAASFVPRVEGLLHTAPRYDGLTQAVAVPVPAGCIKSKNRCKCYDQRGNDYPTTPEVCEQIVQRYLFVDFQQDVNVAGVRSGKGYGDGRPDSPDVRAANTVPVRPVVPQPRAGGLIAGNAMTGPTL